MNRFENKLRKLLSGKFIGNFTSFFKGEGLEVEDFRKYNPGDDIKSINWKLTAKYDTFFVNLFQQEKDTHIDVFFDINSNWKTGNNQSLADKANEAFLELMMFARRSGANIYTYINDYNKKNDKLNVFSLGNDLSYGYWAISKVNDYLNKINSNAYDTNIEKFLRYQMKSNKRHVIIIFSDFLGFSNENKKTLLKLSEKNEVVMVRLPVYYFIGRNFDRFSLDDSNTNISNVHSFKNIVLS